MLDDPKIWAYGQKKKWSIESDPNMILILELSDRSWKLTATNMLKDSVKNMQEHMGNFSIKIKTVGKNLNEMRDTFRKFFKCDLSKLDKTEEKNQLKVGQQKLLKLKYKEKEWKNASWTLISVGQNWVLCVQKEKTKKMEQKTYIKRIMVRNLPNL